MHAFFELHSALQVLLLLLSQITMVALVTNCILLFRYRRVSFRKLVIGVALLLVNIAAYIPMQLDSRITRTDGAPRLPIAYALLLLLTVASLHYAIKSTLAETKNRKVINDTSIKESFDNLPSGACFFNEMGLPVLCNRAMHRFSFAVSGKDVQYITDLDECLQEDFVPTEGVRRDGKSFVFPNMSVWRLDKRSVRHDNGVIYTQFVAADITQLYEKRLELAKENDNLSKVQADLQRLSANVVTATREEEILNTKMRVHDEMGRCLVEARKYLREDAAIPPSVVHSWSRAISMLKYNNDSVQEDMLAQIRKTCQSLNVALVETGELPKQENAAYLLTCAIRECLTNAVRYGGATELYASFSETDDTASVSVSNNGNPPIGKIIEGGGLSTLRRRVERDGGCMLVQSQPQFKLTVTVPKEKEVGV